MLDPLTQRHFHDLARWMALQCRRAGRCLVFGINGAQGSGKSTLAGFLRNALRDAHGLRAAVLSLDDCYLGRADRLRLAAQQHPLFATRGVPGTHDPALGRSLLCRLRELRAGESMALPAFSKALDDRLPESGWSRVDGPLDLILFEGWCVGTPAQGEGEWVAPVNALESQADADGRWRRQVNAYLGGAYAGWFAQIDRLVFLQVPDFDCVLRWRWQQECETVASQGGGPGGRLLSRDQLESFVRHYERLTRHALAVLPHSADALLRLDRDHRVVSLQLRGDEVGGGLAGPEA